MSATESLARIVSLVAELTARERAGAPGMEIEELARSFGTTRAQIERDLRTLTRLGEQADGDWLLSLRVYQQGNRVSVSSQGPFRRPLRLTVEELLALQVALISTGEVALARRLSEPPQPPVGSGGDARPAATIDQDLEEALAGRRRIRCRYAGEGKGEPRERILQPHQLFEYRQRVFLLAWCESSGEWRRFRVDRILEAKVGDPFQPRADFVPVSSTDNVFSAGSIEEVTVRYRGGAARWARERFPGSSAQADGSVLVRFNVANPEWLVRTVLEVGGDAEVVEPAEYRTAMRAAMA